MSYELALSKRYEPEATDYKGEAEYMEAEFTGIPGLKYPILWAIEAKSAMEGGQLLTVEIWQDTEPTFDKYKLKIALHASPFAWTALIAAIAAILGIITIIAWKVIESVWPKIAPTLNLMSIAGIGMAAMGLLYLAKKKT